MHTSAIKTAFIDRTGNYRCCFILYYKSTGHTLTYPLKSLGNSYETYLKSNQRYQSQPTFQEQPEKSKFLNDFEIGNS